ncbi:unnamed protein product [Coregonus sp. 'balchen']|nr:unnamed protein product [Coregonus sp. 'balchen']
MYPEIYHILTNVPQTQRIDIPRDIPHTDQGLMYPEIYHILTNIPQTQRTDVPRDIPHTDQGTTDTED